MAHPQASAGSGTKLNSKIGKGRPRSEASQVKGAPENHPIDEEGLICIRRLAERSFKEKDQRRADYDFLARYYGYETENEVASMFHASDDHVYASLARRRLEKEASVS